MAAQLGQNKKVVETTTQVVYKPKPGETSLSIIEDCLERIYQSRRATLLSKARKFKEKQARKAFDRSENISSSANVVAQADSALSGYAEKDVLEELDVKYRAPPVAAAPYVKERSKIAKQYEDQDAEALSLFRTFCNDLREVMEEYPMRLPEDEFRATYCDDFMMKYFNAHFDKMMATRTLSKIRKHATHIIEEFALQDNTPHILQLINIALEDCASLDHKKSTAKAPVNGSKSAEQPDTDGDDVEELPAARGKPGPSGVIKGIGKSTVTGAQATAQVPAATTTTTAGVKSKASTQAALESEAVPKVQINKGNANANTASAPTAAAVQAVGSTAPTQSAPAKQQTGQASMSAADRQKSDKQRIKAQYEQLMSIKKKAVNHPDDETIQQYSALHADIQSVIDSIQQSRPVK
jgi:hypothetical protein